MGWSHSLNRQYQNNKKLFNRKFYGKRTVGRLWLRWKECLVVAEYRGMEEVSRGQKHLEANK
jgi:hypothetical protein